MFGLLGRLGIRNSLRAGRDVVRGGGPAGLRVVEIHRPEGLLVPTVEIDLEIPLRNGGKATLSPGVPLPPPLVWPWRAGRVGLAIRDRFVK